MMRKGKGKTTTSGKLLPNSWRVVSSCLKTVTTNASTVVRSAVAAAISSSTDDHKDQVTWAGFDKLEFRPTAIKHVLLVGYVNGFQVIDVEDESNYSELVSKRDGPITFLQILPAPLKDDVKEEISSLHPILLVVAGDEDSCRRPGHNHTIDCRSCNSISPSNTLRFYSFRSNCYVKVLSFPSPVLMVRSGPQVIAVGLKSQIYCIDNLSLEKKFNVSTYPVPQFEGQGQVINTGYGPMAVGPRWLAYAPENPYVSNTGCLSPKNLNFPGVSPSRSPGNSGLIARYAMQSGKQFATGIMNLGDKGYKTLSKYYPDFLPDVAGSPGWNVGKLTAPETEKAGMVVIKDVLSTAIVSQFRAHTSPISALCFDPSGTLLVTASVHGNNIHIFRIMPSPGHSGPNCYDWSSSHVHLYKLYRGVTAAIIRDICFSDCSRWICVVSSKGTCHIFLLAPFDCDASVQSLRSHWKDTFIYPVSSGPWWSTSSFTLKEQQSFPPSPSTLTVVTRIKDSSSSLLHTVNVAASSATGMKLAPNGAIAATFHTSVAHCHQDVHLAAGFLEHLLVYTPTGFVVQHKLLPSVGTELYHGSPKIQPGLQVRTQDAPDEVFRVNAEPVKWWDVCRRSDYPERGDCSFIATLDDEEDPAVDMSRMVFPEKDSAGLNKLVKNDTIKAADRSNWYLSNAEVQMRSARSQIWQNFKICFHVMSPPRSQGYECGELEIERVPSHEVEIKEKDLLPVFDHFHSMKSPWFDRGVVLGCDTSSSSLVNHQSRDKVNEAIVIFHSNPASFSSTESSDGGSSRRMENLPDLDQLNVDKSPTATRRILSDSSEEETGSTKFRTHMESHKPVTPLLLPSEHFSANCYVKDSTLGGFPLVSSKLTSNSCNTDEKLVDFTQVFEERYCNAPERCSPSGCPQFAEVATDELETSSVPCKKEEPQDDGVLSGVFDFFEEAG